MKNRLLLSLMLLAAPAAFAQTNTFPVTGNVGIGTTNPQGLLHVLGSGSYRNYYVNRTIPGTTEDSGGPNYLLLHKAYTNTLVMQDRFVSGKLVATRGGNTGWNRKFVVEVNTTSAYDWNRGNIMSYMEGTRLVYVTYGGERYLALEIANNSTLYYWSFTGYADNAALELAADEAISDVVAFVNHEYTALNGPFSAGYLRVTRPVRDFTSKLSDIDGIFLEGQSTGANLNGEMAIGFAANGGGSSAIGFGRGHGWDTYLRFYTNTYSNAGSYNMMERMVITSDGNVGIGTSAPGTNKLAVDGTIAARKVKVTLANPWPDYVFAKGYELPSIASVEKFIREHQHLPGIPSAEEVKKEGIELGDMNARLLQKVEELTLYLIDLKKENEQLQERVKALESRR